MTKLESVRGADGTRAGGPGSTVRGRGLTLWHVELGSWEAGFALLALSNEFGVCSLLCFVLDSVR